MREVNLVSLDSSIQAQAANNAQSQVKKAVEFSVENLVERPGSQARKLSV